MPDLSEKAMIVALNIGVWTARKHDRRISEEVATTHGAAADAGRYNKTLIDRRHFAKIDKVVRDARAHHYENTLPWLDDGYRILPADNYFEYCDQQRAHRDRFNAAVSEFIAGYPNMVEEARDRLNGLYDPKDYPEPQRIIDKFGADICVLPLPAGADFRVNLSEAETQRVRADIERRTQDAAQAAIRDLWQRIYDTVQPVAEKLAAFSRDSGRTENPFRNSMITNLRELVDLLPRLNFTGDPQLDAMRQRLSDELCQTEPKTLRKNAKIRRDTAAAAAKILDDMAGYC